MLKGKLEALLFSSGRKMDLGELSRLTHAKPEEIQASLAEIKKEYDNKNSSVMIVNEGDSWKLTVREQFLPLVQKIITETELSKTVTETLAVIAFKYPIKQSDLIKIRTNKAYDHLKELEQMGYITRQKHGRTNLIKLTQKFFEYFDLPEEKLKEKFQDFRSIAKAIEDKETEIDAIKKEQKASAEEEKKKDDKIKQEIDLLDDEGRKIPLEDYGNKEETSKKDEKEELGDLEVVNEPSEKELEKERERIQKIKEEGKKRSEFQKEPSQPNFESIGIKTTLDMENLIDKKVEKLLHPPEEMIGGKDEKEKSEAKSEQDEPKDLLEAEMEKSKKEKGQDDS